MEKKIANTLQAWLDQPEAKRDVATGAMLVRRITRNAILAGNYEKFPKRFAGMVEYQLRKFYPMVMSGVQHEQVEQMSKQVEQIAKERKLDAELPGTARQKEVNRVAKTEEFVKGKRADHNSLPEEIQALYSENLAIMQQMRHNRAQLLVLVNGPQSSCPDGDRYPFVSELIKLDAQYRANWKQYDEYVAPDGDK